jgi:hypothetical protein
MTSSLARTCGDWGTFPAPQVVLLIYRLVDSEASTPSTRHSSHQPEEFQVIPHAIPCGENWPASRSAKRLSSPVATVAWWSLSVSNSLGPRPVAVHCREPLKRRAPRHCDACHNPGPQAVDARFRLKRMVTAKPESTSMGDHVTAERDPAAAPEQRRFRRRSSFSTADWKRLRFAGRFIFVSSAPKASE